MCLGPWAVFSSLLPFFAYHSTWDFPQLKSSKAFLVGFVVCFTFWKMTILCKQVPLEEQRSEGRFFLLQLIFSAQFYLRCAVVYDVRLLIKSSEINYENELQYILYDITQQNYFGIIMVHGTYSCIKKVYSENHSYFSSY